MARNKLTDVRDHMIEAMEKLNSGDMEAKDAKAMADLGKVLVESAKAEVEFIKATGAVNKSTGFFNLEGQNIIDISSGEIEADKKKEIQ